MDAAAYSAASGGVVGVPAAVLVGCTHATGIFGIAFPFALVAGDAGLPRALALGDCC